MKIPNFSNLKEKIKAFIPKEDIEKLVLKILLGAWLLIVIVLLIVRISLGARDDIERKIVDAATSVEYSTRSKIDIERYEALLSQAKYPEEVKQYAQHLRRDPFLEYKDVVIMPLDAAEHNFSIKSIDRMPLPVVYKGYIELPDKMIGQINWRDATRFVEVGETINGYRIQNIAKGKIEAIDENGERIEFKLNKVIHGDEWQAVLFDNISKKTYSIQRLGEIDNYKVVDIASNYVILRLGAKEIKLEK